MNGYESAKSGYPSEWQALLFSQGMKYLDKFLFGLGIHKGKRAAQPFTTELNKIKALEKRVSAKRDSPPFLKEKDVRQRVTAIFKKHIQAPAIVIANRVAELLALFGIRKRSEKKSA